MKILMVGRYFYPVIGGVELHMQNLAHELIKKGHDVEVFTSNDDFKGEKLPAEDEIERIKIRRFPNVFSLCKGILNSNHDVIHYHLFRKVYVDIASSRVELLINRLFSRRTACIHRSHPL